MMYIPTEKIQNQPIDKNIDKYYNNEIPTTNY